MSIRSLPMKNLCKILLFSFLLSTASVVPAQTPRSEQLYDTAMELFTQGKFKDAAEKFRLSWEDDSINVDKKDLRHDSSKDWSAYSYYKAGNEKMAKNLSPLMFDIKPADRRLTPKANKYYQDYIKAIEDNSLILAQIYLDSALEYIEKETGTDNSLFLSVLVEQIILSFEKREYDNMLKHISRLEKQIDKLNPQSTYFKANCNLFKGFVNFERKKFKEALEYARLARRQLSGSHIYDAGKLLHLYRSLIYYSDREVFGSYENALSELRELIKENKETFYSLSPDEQLDATNLMSSVFAALQDIGGSDYDSQIKDADRYIEVLRKGDNETYPFLGEYLAQALQFRASQQNYKANKTGTGYEEVLRDALEALELLKNYPQIPQANYIDLMNVATNALISLNRLEEALELNAHVLEIVENPLNDRQFYLFEAVPGRSIILNGMGETRLAIQNMEKYLPTIRKMKNQYPSNAANFLFNYSTFVDDQKDVLAALKETVECVEKNSNPWYDPVYFHALLKIIQTDPHNIKLCDEAISKIEEGIRNLEQNPHQNPLMLSQIKAELLHTKSIMSNHHGNADEALDYNSQAIELTKKSGLKMNPDYYMTRMSIQKAKNKFSEALETGEQLLSIMRANFGKNHPALLNVMFGMMDTFMGNLEFNKAQQLADEILDILKYRSDDIPRPLFAQYLQSLSDFYKLQNNFDEALRMLEYIPQLDPTYLSDKDRRLQWLSSYIPAKAKTEKKDEVLAECKKLVEESKVKDLTDDARFTLLTIAGIGASQIGEIGYAANWFEKAFKDFEPADPSAVSYLNALSEYTSILNQLGKPQEASRLYLKGIDTLANNEDFPEFFNQAFSTLLGFYQNYDSLDIPNVISQLKELMNKAVKSSGFGAGMIPYIQQTITEFNSLMPDYDPKKEYADGMEIIDYMKGFGGDVQPQFYLTMALTALNAGWIDDAEKMLDAAEQNGSSQLKLTDMANLLTLRSRIAFLRNDTYSSFNYLREVFDMSQLFVLNNFLSMSTEERENFWNNANASFRVDLPQIASNFLGSENMDGMASLVYDAALFTNSLLLASDITVDEAAARSDNKKVKKAYKEYLSLKHTVAEAEQRISKTANPDESLLQTMEQLRESLRKTEHYLLDLLSSQFGQYNRHLAIRSEDVRKTLHPTDAAIELLEFPDEKNHNIINYLAAVIRGDREEVTLVPLFSTTSDPDQWNLAYENETLYENLWKPLIPHLQGITDIWFAPQGMLSVTAIESLPGLEKMDLGNPFTLHRLTSTRQLVLEDMKRSQCKSGKRDAEFVAYGGINYSADSKSINAADRQRQRSNRRGTRSLLTARDIFGKDKRDVDAKIEPLPGTKEEAEFLVNLVKDEKKGKATLLDEEKASESSFKDFSGKMPGLMHIGTHGFYFGSNGAGSSGAMSAEALAMQRSGLLLAGAETGLFQPESLPADAEDGILTAAEIARLDMSDSDLIVMSACETGLGKVGADGVFGLQRGFKKAGASALMMSLWKVDDDATAQLMQTFYEGWLKEGLTKSQALEKAKEKVRTTPGWSNPRYWAPFILLDAIDR